VVVTGLLAFAAWSPARAETELVAGSAAASATVAEINVPYGGANVGASAGLANASYFERSAKASASVFEPSFLRLSTILKFCDTGFPIDLPLPTSATASEATGPDAHHKEQVPGVAVEDASAEPGSHSHSLVVSGSFGIPGVVELAGGEAETEARLDPGVQARSARAEVRAGTIVLAGGLVELRGSRWTSAQQAIGPDSRTLEVTQQPEFELGAIVLAGLPLPTATPAELEDTLASVNQLLGPLGIQVRLPKVKAVGDRGVEVTSLTIAIGGDPVYGPALFNLIAGPDGTSLINLYNTLTQPTLIDPATCNSLFGLLKASPELNSLVNTFGTVAPIVVSAVAAAFNGGAEVDVNIGGVRTTYDATYFPPRTVAIPAPRPAPNTVAGVPGSVVAAPASGPTELAGSPTKVSSSCATTSPVGRPGCWKGSGPIAATLAAAVTAGLFATDELGRRRRRARSIEELE
jgi:hypothetical protein